MVIPAIAMLLRMGTSTILGAAIGYERERSGHPAGLRTHLLVALASTTFMLVSTQFVYFQTYRKEDLIAVDTSRIAASVVTGIGFLGAGAIIRNGINVQGLTTAASLWLVAAIGLAAGAGMYTVAIVATLTALFCLTILRQIEGLRWHVCQRQIEIVGKKPLLNRHLIQNELKTLGHVVKDLECDDNLAQNELRLTFELRFSTEHAVEPLLTKLESLPGIMSIKLIRTG
ncbi:MgtC/SapB family protein [Schlesneria paludicola]|uniref:MgtC/SapB family protein n=1 Tax=Schlesneria paludicola TaxID=360056 RepID=UPI00029AD8DA|nr:MgtC/SapB family protein [Schlesneria paludicola]